MLLFVTFLLEFFNQTVKIIHFCVFFLALFILAVSKPSLVKVFDDTAFDGLNSPGLLEFFLSGSKHIDILVLFSRV